MRTAWLCSLSLLLVTLHACSDDGDGGEENAAGSAGSANTAGRGGSSNAAGAAGSNMAGTGGSNAAGAAGSSMAGTGGSNAAGLGGAAGSTGESGATGCNAYCERSLAECTNDNFADCLRSCEMNEALCPAESAAQLACLEPRPDSDFRCLNGITDPKVDVCATETTELQRCVFFG